MEVVLKPGQVLTEDSIDGPSLRCGGSARTRVYDSAGRLCKLTAGGFYDGLTTCETVTDPTPTSWGGGTYPAGKLTRRLGYNPGGSPQLLVRDDFAYTTNPAGRLSSQATYFNSGALGSATQSWIYNSFGLVTQHAHSRSSGSPFIVNTLYSRGFPTTEYANGIAVVAATYQPTGALATYTTGPGIGGNVVTNIAQASNGIARPSRISAQPVGSAAFDTGTFVYDGAGNITGMGPDVFTYDARSRLCSAALSGVGTQYYGYDRFGNLITKGTSATPCASSTSWSNKNRVPTATYDLNVASGRGNLTSYNGTSYNFDSLDRLTGTVTPAWSYLFDGSSERIVKALSGSLWTYTLRDEGKRVSTEYVGSSPEPTISRDNLFLGNLLVASLANPAVSGNGPVWSFYSSDHLGTPRLVTYVDGSQVETRRHWPYGEDIGTVSAFERVRFASMERDTEDSTYHDHARHEEFTLGRFLSVDLIDGQVSDPQTWNRYSYARANPLKLVDPDGLALKVFGATAPQTILELAGDSAMRIAIHPDGTVDTSQLTAEDLENEPGAALIDQLSSSASVYNYTEGTTIETAGGPAAIETLRPTNLDNNPDDRLKGGKNQQHLPPGGVDSAIGINSTVQYYVNGVLVPRAHIAYHELVEPREKVDHRKPYAAAHATAIAKEKERIKKCPQASSCTTEAGVEARPIVVK